MSAGWARPSPCDLWGGNTLLLSTGNVLLETLGEGLTLTLEGRHLCSVYAPHAQLVDGAVEDVARDVLVCIDTSRPRVS